MVRKDGVLILGMEKNVYRFSDLLDIISFIVSKYSSIVDNDKFLNIRFCSWYKRNRKYKY